MNLKSSLPPQFRRILKSGVRRIWLPRVDVQPQDIDLSHHRLAFLFHGHIGTWPEIGNSLYREKTVFRESIQKCSFLAEKLVGIKITDYFEGIKSFPLEGSQEEELLEYLCEFSLDIALCDLWKSVGLYPSAIVGVCRGSIPAAYAAGALSLEDSLAVHLSMIAIKKEKYAEGYWLALMLTYERARALASQSGAEFHICVEMSPNLTMGYCTITEFEKVKQFLEEQKVGYQVTPCTFLSHIFQESHLKDIKQELFYPKPLPLAVPYYSGLTGEVFPAGTVLKPEYWYLSYLMPVQFTKTISAAITAEFDVFLNVCGLTPFNFGLKQVAVAMNKQITSLDSVSRHEPELNVWNQSFNSLSEYGLVKANPQNAEGQGIEVSNRG